MAKKKDNLKDITFIDVPPTLPREEVIKKFYETKGPVMLTEVPRIPPLTETEKLTNFELEQFEQQLIIDGTDMQVRKLVNEVKAYRSLMEKYGIPNLEYLEQCIKRSDKYGELEEKIGCPLEVYCRMTKEDGVFVEKDGQMVRVVPLIQEDSFWDIKDIEKRLFATGRHYLKDYKVTWWLKADRSE